VVDALERLPSRRGLVFPAPEGARINIDNFRHRGWTPALAAARTAISWPARTPPSASLLDAFHQDSNRVGRYVDALEASDAA
jgi:hypothetical protein